MLAAVAAAPAPADDDFPVVGTYSKDLPCEGDGSRRPELRVKISRSQIESTMGLCNILNRRREGKAFHVHLQCKLQSDQVILGDVTFTPRADGALDFDDQDHTSPAILYRCRH
jgi:hypothetical protein